MVRILGITLALVGLAAAIVLGSTPASFLNIPGLLFVLLVGLGVIVAGHGSQGISSLGSLFSQTKTPEQKRQAKRVLETAIKAFVAAGWIGVMIGVIQLLSALDDPAQMGVGVATALLTAFYGYIAAYVFCFPISRSLEA